MSAEKWFAAIHREPAIQWHSNDSLLMLLNPQQFSNSMLVQAKTNIRKGGFLPIICLSKINNYSFIREHLTRRSKACKYDLFSLKKVLFICLFFVCLVSFI